MTSDLIKPFSESELSNIRSSPSLASKARHDLETALIGASQQEKTAILAKLAKIREIIDQQQAKARAASTPGGQQGENKNFSDPFAVTGSNPSLAGLQNIINSGIKSGDIIPVDKNGNPISKSSQDPNNIPGGNSGFFQVKNNKGKYASAIRGIFATFRSLGFETRQSQGEQGTQYHGVLFPESYKGNTNPLTMTDSDIQRAKKAMEKDSPGPIVKKESVRQPLIVSITFGPNIALILDLAAREKKKWRDKLSSNKGDLYVATARGKELGVENDNLPRLVAPVR